MVSGKVISKEKQEVVDFATVYLKGTTYGCTTNEEGIYHLHAPAGKYTLVVSAIGYETIEKPITLVHGERIKMNVMIAPSPYCCSPSAKYHNSFLRYGSSIPGKDLCLTNASH